MDSSIVTPSSSDDDEGSRQGFWSRFFGGKERSVEAAELPQTTVIEQNVVQLKDQRIADVAIPKAEIVALHVDASIDTISDQLRAHGYSRYPVYRDTLDDPIGLVHVKDIVMTYGFEMSNAEFALEPFLRPLLFAPPSMRVLTLLQKMQSEHIHMALVIDEFGGVDGLITIEDILEQIVGDITDEHDDEEDLWQQEKPGVYLVQARAQIDEFEEDTEIKLPEPDTDEDIDTIGGLIITLASRLPTKGEVIKSEEGFEFEIVEADPRRIKRVRIRLPRMNFEADL